MKVYYHKNRSRSIFSYIDKIPVLKENECEQNTGFKLRHGNLLGNFKLLNVDYDSIKRGSLELDDSAHINIGKN